MTAEIWEPVVGYPDYAVSSLGRVKRVVADWQGKHLERLLVGCVDRDGYRRVTLTAKERKKIMKVCRVVCHAFHGDPAPNMQAAHRNGDKTNDSASNLYWATPAENGLDKVRLGESPAGSRNGRAKLTDSDVRDIRADTQIHRKIARQHGVSMSLIGQIKRREIWGHIA